MLKLTATETTYSVIVGKYAYKLVDTAGKGVLIRRTLACDPMWNHGVLTEMFDTTLQKFIQSILAGTNVRVADLSAACKLIENQVE